MITLTIEDEAKGAASRLPPKIEEAVTKGLMALALMGQGAAQRSILSGPKTGRVYRRGKGGAIQHRASAAGEAPANDLGYLVANIKVDMSDKFTANLRSLASYSIHLEYGTVHMEPRPFIRLAGESVRDKAPEVFDAYIGAALK